MIEIDGSKGGGQMLRTSLSLSAITGKPFRMENIRGSRPNPGMKRQHLEAVKAAARLCDAEVEGLQEGSREIVFQPSELSAENFTVNIGTAGSVTLLLDTLLPITTHLDEDLRVDVKGGTDVKWSPTAGYYRHVKLPLLKEYGLDASLEVERTGFYPAGGGEIRLETSPYSMEPVEIRERGGLEGFEIYSKASRDLQESQVAERQASEVARKLKNSHISVPIEKDTRYVETDSTGSSLVLEAVYENSVAGFDSLGEHGKRSEEVARE
ncbi:MAG: RNA 3'-terminal phosphate cyclase, partial [Candidatus Nanohaloarchaea archaeon]